MTRLLSRLRPFDAASAEIAKQRSTLVSIDEEARSHPQADAGLNPAAAVRKIRELVDDDAAIACDAGSHYIYMARHFRGCYPPRRVLFSNGSADPGRRIAGGDGTALGPLPS